MRGLNRECDSPVRDRVKGISVKPPRVSEQQVQAAIVELPGKLAARPVRMAPARRSKYRAVKSTVDGVTFHSQAEARRYSELKLLERAGEIRTLVLQPRFPLEAWTNGRIAHGGEVLGQYVADFRYEVFSRGLGRWRVVVEDVKGFSTPLYKWKKRHVEAQYGITVVEIRRR